MGVGTEIYKQYIGSRGNRRKVWSLVRKMMIRLLNDPICSLPVHRKVLKLPLSHQLPLYVNLFEFYDQLPQRISNFIHSEHGKLICIDVGANIGDTIASFYEHESDSFLAIEPNPKFNKLLFENWEWNKNVTVISELCSSNSSDCTVSIEEINGTATIRESKIGCEMRKRTLDEIVQSHPFALDANVIKIDTDGHDLDVIEGARKLIKKNLPVILFECEPLDNNYIRRCMETLNFFVDLGYTSFLLYTSFGDLLGKYQLFDLVNFRYQLFVQKVHELHDFDVLVMKDEDLSRFYASEVDYFETRLSGY